MRLNFDIPQKASVPPHGDLSNKLNIIFLTLTHPPPPYRLMGGLIPRCHKACIPIRNVMLFAVD